MIKVISETTFASKCLRNPKHFVNMVLKKGKSKMQRKAARVFQFLCIDWLYQQLLLTFCINFSYLHAKVMLVSDAARQETLMDAILFIEGDVLPMYYDSAKFPRFNMTGVQQSMQRITLYDFLAKALIWLSTPKTNQVVDYEVQDEIDLSYEAVILHVEHQEGYTSGQIESLKSQYKELHLVVKVRFSLFQCFCFLFILFLSLTHSFHSI